MRDFPTALIEARIVAGLTQKQLGERLEVKEQQIQRWEANLYSGVGVERQQEVADALGMGLIVAAALLGVFGQGSTTTVAEGRKATLSIDAPPHLRGA